MKKKESGMRETWRGRKWDENERKSWWERMKKIESWYERREERESVMREKVWLKRIEETKNKLEIVNKLWVILSK